MAAPDEIPLEFQVPPDDPSGLMLQNLFGSGWDQIGESSGSVYSAASMIYDVLSAFNIVALAVVSVLFAITFTSGAIGTANEGTPLGKRFSATWMPLRFALSISALAPIFKGGDQYHVAACPDLSAGDSPHPGNGPSNRHLVRRCGRLKRKRFRRQFRG